MLLINVGLANQTYNLTLRLQQNLTLTRNSAFHAKPSKRISTLSRWRGEGYTFGAQLPSQDGEGRIST